MARISNTKISSLPKSDGFPIRRETNEIYESNLYENSVEKTGISNKNSIFSKISSEKKNIGDLKEKGEIKQNQIPFIVLKNEKTLEDLNKHSKLMNVNLYHVLLENQKDFKTISKVLFFSKSKHKSYSNSDPLNTRIKFNFTDFLKKKVTEMKQQNNQNDFSHEKGWKTERNNYVQTANFNKRTHDYISNKNLMKKIRSKLKSQQRSETQFSSANIKDFCLTKKINNISTKFPF